MPKEYNISKLENGFLLSYMEDPEREKDKGDGLIPAQMKEHRQAFKTKEELSKKLSELL